MVSGWVRLAGACTVGVVIRVDCVWRPWRSREQSHIAQLGWLPSLLRERPADLVVRVTSSQDGYYERTRRLGVCFITLIEQCQKDGLYGAGRTA